MWVYFAGEVALNLVFTILIISAVATLAVTAGRRASSPAGFRRTARSCCSDDHLLADGLCDRLLGALEGGVDDRQPCCSCRCRACPACSSLKQLPDVLQRIGPVAADLPLRPDRVAGHEACYGCDDYGADAGGSLALHIVVILAWTLLGLVLTAWGYQRELDRERSCSRVDASWSVGWSARGRRAGRDRRRAAGRRTSDAPERPSCGWSRAGCSVQALSGG